MSDFAIKADNVTKQYRLGAIGGGTLQGDIQSAIARMRGKEDPNSKIGSKMYAKNEKFLALDDISFDVKHGEALGIIGRNGAGKSTLLKILSRVTAPTKGQIEINGRIASMLEVGTGFHPELTGRENVFLNGAILGMTKAEIKSKFDEIVEFAEMNQFIDTPVKRYSSGMYVKLAFSVAAHLDSEIMVMDEVLAVGDMKFQQKCLGRMSDAAGKEGRTVLYVSHNMNTIRQICSRCLVLEHGKKIFDGDTEEGVSVYIKENTYSTETRRIYKDVQRPAWLTKRTVNVQSVEYEGRDSCVFKRGDTVGFTVVWNNLTKIDKLCIRLELLTRENTPVATSILNNFYSGEAGDVCRYTFNYDIHELVEGEYCSIFTFYHINEFGTHETSDWISSLNIIVEKNINSITWDKLHWGNIQLKAPDVTEK